MRNQVIGDKYTSLLKIISIAIENEASSSIVSYFDNLHYVNVKTNRITRINISIRTKRLKKLLKKILKRL